MVTPYYFSTNLSYDHTTPCSEKCRKFWVFENTIKLKSIDMNWLFIWIGNHNHNFHLNKTLSHKYSTYTFWHKHPKQVFSLSRSVDYFTFLYMYVSRFLHIWFGIPKDGTVVQLCRMAFLNKIYTCSPRGVYFYPPISKSSVGTSIFYFIS